MAINRNVYQLLMQDGYTVELVVPESLNFPSGRKTAETRRATDPVLHYLALKGDNPRTYYFEGLEKILNEYRPSVVLLDNDPVSRLALATGQWCQKNKAKLFCISCENLPLTISSALQRRGVKNIPAAIVKRFLLYKTRKVIDGVFTLNSDGKKIFTEEGFGLVEKMPLGYDPAYFYSDAAAGQIIKQQLGLNKKVIAYFGRLTREKGVHILIQALAGLQEKEWVLMMDKFDAYASPYKAEVQALLTKAAILDRVIFISPTHYEIAAYMNAADIVVVPSVSAAHWKEQYGRVAAEAMACGVKLIASDSGALPELLNNFGWLFEEGNVEAIRQLLKGFLEGTIEEGHRTPDAIAAYAKSELSIVKQKAIMQSAFEKAMHLN